MVWCKAHFNTSNRLGVARKCDGRTDNHTDRQTGRHYAVTCRFTTLRGQKRACTLKSISSLKLLKTRMHSKSPIHVKRQCFTVTQSLKRQQYDALKTVWAYDVTSARRVFFLTYPFTSQLWISECFSVPFLPRFYSIYTTCRLSYVAWDLCPSCYTSLDLSLIHIWRCRRRG